MWRSASVTATALACLAGCAAQGPQPTAQLTRAQTLVNQADKSQAQQYAPADLQRSRDELSAAEAANNKGDYDAARGLAESAAVDADVASARAQAGEAQHALQEALESNRTLERESQHRTDSNAAPSTPQDR